MYEAHRTGLSTPSWEREMDLQLSRRESSSMLMGWHSEPAPPNQPPADRRMRTWRSTAGTFSGATANVSWRPATAASRTPIGLDTAQRHAAPSNGAFFCYKGNDGLWWLPHIGEISLSKTTDRVYLVRPLDDPGPIKLPLSPTRYTKLARSHLGRSNVARMDLEAQCGSPRRSIACLSVSPGFGV